MTSPPVTLRYLLFATHVPASGSGGGIVRYTVGLARGLAARSDVELHVLASAAGAPFFADLLPPDRVHVVPGPTPARSLQERLGVVPALRRLRFDVVHGTKHIVPRTARGALRVLTVHDTLLMDRPTDYHRLKRTLLRAPYVASVRDADRLVAVSRATRDRLLDYAPGAADHMAAIPLAPSDELARTPAAPVPELAGRRFALIVSDALARKNLELAVRTWPKVRAVHDDAVLVVVGPPSTGEEHRGATWDDQVAAGAIVPLGFVPGGQLRWLYENARVSLFPSLVEGFGLPAAEAASLGSPVLTSDDPAMCEATAGWGRAVAAWDDDAWARAVAEAVGADPAPPLSGLATPLRTWDDVAAETLEVVREVRADVGLGDRIGVSPYAAPLRVLHVVPAGDPGTRQAVEALAEAHRRNGWAVTVANALPAGVSFDVVALHGRGPARLRRTLRGSVVTVVFASGVPGRAARVAEGRRAPWTNALVLPHGAAHAGADRVPVPVTRLRSPGLDPDEVAAVLVRARAWGRLPSRA